MEICTLKKFRYAMKGTVVVTPKPPFTLYGKTMGQRMPSFMDLYAVNIFYGCIGTLNAAFFFFVLFVFFFFVGMQMGKIFIF